MKGIVYTDFGHPSDVLKVMEVEKPVPSDNQVLIKVKAASVGITEYKRFLEPVNGQEVTALTRQLDNVILKALGQVIGSDISGIVEQVGKDITNVKVGDEVFAVTAGLLGGYSEYAVANAQDVCVKPASLSFDDAATVTTCATVALGAARAGDIKDHQKILIVGASGGVGTYMVQVAKAFGADVTAVCSTRNNQMVKNLGADTVIDYYKEDFASGNEKYDCIIAINGYKPLEVYKGLLIETGKFIAVGGEAAKEAMTRGAEVFNGSEKMIPISFFGIERELPVIKELIDRGIITPVVDKTYSIKDLSEAIVEIVKNHAQGKIAINIDF